ncbi:hypothetical protein FSP39_017695 [Pinctada imbricata]|uniref:VWFA domain-containing protein n=1 Tax=Pinctada imbricata TaxID=66713 RepID=A0AA89C1U2_PINIB|nr:hypothetical protein FSP39_017695 [Pinctada imbricata]
MASGCTVTSKIFLWALGLIFWGAAAGLFFVGGWVFSTYKHYNEITEANFTLIPAVIIICVGVFLFIIGITSCVAACKENKCLLACLFSMLLVVLTAEIGAGALGYAFRKDVADAVENGLHKAIREYESGTLKDQVNYLQKELHCCGFTNASDWFKPDTKWHLNHTYVPESCCAHSNCSLQSRTLTSNSTAFYEEGCYNKLEDTLQSNLAYIAGIAITFAVIQMMTNSHSKPAFNLGDNLEKRETISAIRRINYLSGGTNTAEALDLLSTTMFSGENGGRNHVPHVAVVVTDGESHDTSATAQAAKRARDNGTKLLAIGVGPGADERELKLIASDPDDKHVFKVTNYRTLQEIVESMINRTCEVLKTTVTPVTTASTSTSVTSTPVSTQSTPVNKNCGGKPADVYFLLDSSSSIHQSEFKKEVDFVKELVDIFEIGQNATRVGVSTFSDKYQEVIHFGDHDEKATLLTALDQVPYLGGGTDTANAIRRVRTEEFTTDSARREVAHILIVMTDGLSSDPFGTAQEAKLAKETGMYIFAIGIGQSVRQSRVELDSKSK